MGDNNKMSTFATINYTNYQLTNKNNLLKQLVILKKHYG